MFFDNVKKLKEERDYWKSMYEELKAQVDEWDKAITEEINMINESDIASDKKPDKANTFKGLNIPIGTTLYYRFDPSITVVTVDDKSKVAYNNNTYSITGIGCRLRNEEGKSGDSGFNLFKLNPNGKTLFYIGKDMRADGTYSTVD